MHRRPDRRVQRTRQALQQAMFALVLEKGYEAVTVQDVLDRADVGRSTFYAHFQGKEDLLTSPMGELRAMLAEHQRAAWGLPGGLEQRCLGFSRALFDHAEGYRDIFRALVGERSSAIVLGRMRAMLSELVGEDFDALGLGGAGRTASVQFIVGGLMALMTWWLEHRRTMPAAEIDARFRALALPALLAANPP